MTKKFVIILLGTLLLTGFAIVAHAEKAVHIQWVCSYCGHRISSVRMPGGTCFKSPTKTHNWIAERYY